MFIQTIISSIQNEVNFMLKNKCILNLKVVLRNKPNIDVTFFNYVDWFVVKCTIITITGGSMLHGKLKSPKMCEKIVEKQIWC